MIEQKIRRQQCGGAGAAPALQQTIEDDRALGHHSLNHESHCLMFRSMCRQAEPMTIVAEIVAWHLHVIRSKILPAPFKRVAGAAHSALRRVLDLALPQLCAACCEPVEGRGLCPACWSKLSFITRPYCERLGHTLRLRPRTGCFVDGGDCRSAGL